jgi:hypothetical protein
MRRPNDKGDPYLLSFFVSALNGLSSRGGGGRKPVASPFFPLLERSPPSIP